MESSEMVLSPISLASERAENFGAFTHIRRRKQQNLATPKGQIPWEILE